MKKYFVIINSVFLLFFALMFFLTGSMAGCNGGGGDGGGTVDPSVTPSTSPSQSPSPSPSVTIPPVEEYQPLSIKNDWIPQDYPGSQAITSVENSGGTLVLDCDFVGGDANKTNGEVYQDLSYVRGLESKVPMDFSNRTITAKVKVPEAFVGDPSKPNGVQLFVKDKEGDSQYSEWVNIVNDGKYLYFDLTLKPESDGGFDATQVKIIGVKFGIGSGSTDTYNGYLYVTQLTVTPSIYQGSPPSLSEIIPVPLFSSNDSVTTGTDRIYLNEKKWFIVGTNWRMIEYGQNFGTTAWFPKGNGVTLHRNFINAYMEYLKNSGVRVIRVFLLCDGRTVFDKDGNVTGYNTVFKNDVSTLLNLAQSNNLKIEFVLFDFQMAGKASNDGGVWVRGRSKIITDETTRNNFKKGFLQPFLISYGNHPSVYGFDIMNEPEWLVSKSEGGGWEDVTDSTKPDQPIPVSQMNQFFSECIESIRLNTDGKLVTVGVSCTKVGLVENVDIDYYALHYYPYMGDLSSLIASIPSGKPWVLEEFPSDGGSSEVTGYYTTILNNKGSGGYFWNYKPGVDNYTVSWSKFNALIEGIRSWYESNQASIY